MSRLEKFFNRLADPSTKTIVYDSETSGLDWRRNHVIGHVFTFGGLPDDSYYFPVRHAGGGNLEDGPAPQVAVEGTRPPLHVFEERTQKVLALRPDLRAVFHHAAFDLHFTDGVGLAFGGPLEDTMVNAALIDENAGSYSLDACCRRAEVQAKKGETLHQHLASLFGGPPDRNQMGNLWRTRGDDPIVVDYAAGDGTSTWQLWEKQQTILDAEDLRRVWAVECRCIRTFHRMERQGVRVDEEALHRLEKDIGSRIDAARSSLPDGFNQRSPAQVRAFMETQGVTDWPLTPQGAPSFPEEWLLRSEAGRKVIAVRKLRTLLDSFITPLKETHLWNGKVHTHYNQLKSDEYGTVSGRPSSSEPNLQQVPKRDKILAPLFRSVFIPDPGMVWYENDYMQQEYFVFANYTRAKKIIDGYMQEPPIDIHQTVADMLGVERDPTAKRINLGQLYGMGYKKLALKLGVSETVAKGYSLQYQQMVPEAKQFSKAAETRAKETGYVFDILGRRRRFPDSRFAHKAANGIIQGSSASITKLKMCEIDEYFAQERNAANLMLQIFDSMSWQAEAGSPQTEHARHIMTSFGENDVIRLALPLRIDTGEGPNWSVATWGR